MQEFTKLRGKYWKGVLWSPSYFAGICGGASLDVLKSYIKNQNAPQVAYIPSSYISVMNEEVL